MNFVSSAVETVQSKSSLIRRIIFTQISKGFDFLREVLIRKSLQLFQISSGNSSIMLNNYKTEFE